MTKKGGTLIAENTQTFEHKTHVVSIGKSLIRYAQEEAEKTIRQNQTRRVESTKVQK